MENATACVERLKKKRIVVILVYVRASSFYLKTTQWHWQHTHTHTGSFKDFHTRHRQVYAPALSRPNKKAPGREENGNSSAKKTL
jgi:hypothetical protein